MRSSLPIAWSCQKTDSPVHFLQHRSACRTSADRNSLALWHCVQLLDLWVWLVACEFDELVAVRVPAVPFANYILSRQNQIEYQYVALKLLVSPAPHSVMPATVSVLDCSRQLSCSRGASTATAMCNPSSVDVWISCMYSPCALVATWLPDRCRHSCKVSSMSTWCWRQVVFVYSVWETFH